MEKGIWKKYEHTTHKSKGERASYHDLYDDLKNSRRSWKIAQDPEECIEQLCGVELRTSGIEPEAGDIYVYYVFKDEKLIPILYFKIIKFDDGEIKHCIEYNGETIGYDGIAIEYLPEVIKKLREIDEEKNKADIAEFEERYNHHQQLLALKSKTEFTEEELLFLYDMYQRKDVDMTFVASKIQNRNIEDDYHNFSEEGKAKLFLIVKGTELANRLSISSKKVMTLIAEKQCLEMLRNAPTEILKDKDYIMELLQTFLESDGLMLMLESIQLYNLPECYLTDPDIISLIFYNGGRFAYKIPDCLEKSQAGIEKINSPEFAYQLVEAFIRGGIRKGEPYYESDLLSMFPNEILKDIEKHIMIGPEPNPSKGLWSGEDLKQISYHRLLTHKAKILQYRKEQ